MEKLRKAEEERRLEDMKVKGYYGGYSSYRSVHTPEQELKTEQELQKEKQIMDEKKLLGESQGLQWIKNEYGWSRGLDLQKTYKTSATNDHLPTWLYDEIDVKFGLRSMFFFLFFFIFLIIISNI